MTRIPFAVALLAGACFPKPHEDPSRFFVLTPVARASQPPVPFAVGIAPITLPDYLDHSQMVTRAAANELTLSELDRWAEPFREGFARTLRQDLSQLLGTDQVFLDFWAPSVRPRWVVAIDVVRFERVEPHRAELLARWTLRDAAGALRVSRETHRSQAIATPDTAAAVQALSQALAGLSQEIAAAMRQPI